jgi:hypothetical protein
VLRCDNGPELACAAMVDVWSLAQARAVLSDWKADYNHRRRHSSAASSVQPPAQTESRANRGCSDGVPRSYDQSIVARSVS